MFKNSVQILLGKPNKATMNTYSNKVRENWEYEINDDYSLDIDFENRKLTNVNQY